MITMKKEKYNKIESIVESIVELQDGDLKKKIVETEYKKKLFNDFGNKTSTKTIKDFINQKVNIVYETTKTWNASSRWRSSYTEIVVEYGLKVISVGECFVTLEDDLHRRYKAGNERILGLLK